MGGMCGSIGTSVSKAVSKDLEQKGMIAWQDFA
jgi:hypothetical protein